MMPLLCQEDQRELDVRIFFGWVDILLVAHEPIAVSLAISKSSYLLPNQNTRKECCKLILNPACLGGALYQSP